MSVEPNKRATIAGLRKGVSRENQKNKKLKTRIEANLLDAGACCVHELARKSIVVYTAIHGVGYLDKKGPFVCTIVRFEHLDYSKGGCCSC